MLHSSQRLVSTIIAVDKRVIWYRFFWQNWEKKNTSFHFLMTYISLFWTDQNFLSFASKYWASWTPALLFWTDTLHSFLSFFSDENFIDTLKSKFCLLLHSEAEVLNLRHLLASTFEYDSLSSTDINITVIDTILWLWLQYISCRDGSFEATDEEAGDNRRSSKHSVSSSKPCKTSRILGPCHEAVEAKHGPRDEAHGPLHGGRACSKRQVWPISVWTGRLQVSAQSLQVQHFTGGPRRGWRRFDLGL